MLVFNLKEAVETIVKKHNILCSELTESQLVDAIKQAIECGDFVRMVSMDRSQSVIYMPYHEMSKLNDKYMELINAVASKYENETRHETALRYITEHENNSSIGENETT